MLSQPEALLEYKIQTHQNLFNLRSIKANDEILEFIGGREVLVYCITDLPILAK